MGDKEIKVLIFLINKESFATNIMEVERILEYEEPTKIPDTPSFIDGVINYEGKILPIISLSRRFHFNDEGITNNTKIIVSKHERGKYGVIVDFVSEVRDVNSSSIEESPDIVGGISKRYIKALIKLEHKIIKFLNLETIITDEEKALL